MKRQHKVTITLTLESDPKIAFDPQAHYNYEFIHANDDKVASKVEKLLPAIIIPGFFTTSVNVENGIETSLLLTPTEQAIAEKYSDNEQEAFQTNSDALDKIAKENGIKHAIWSADATAANIATKSFEGKVRFVSTAEAWRDENWVEKTYRSEVYENPTYIDAWKEFDKTIAFTKDFHHVLLEGFIKLAMEDDVQLIDFSAGS